MPGHKGADYLGIEALDITEVTGADSLYEASGIIAESETNASALFGCPTFYSTEGSSHCIRAMLYLCLLTARQKGLRPTVLAGRNAHKTFISAAALLDFDIRWIYPDESESYLACTVTPEKVAEALFSMDNTPAAVYITSPDYLGNVADIQEENGTHSEIRYDLTHTVVHNSKGVVLPSTGGEGTMMLITIGTMLAIGFAVLLITHKKMSVYTDEF